jgi:hypothetical protein
MSRAPRGSFLAPSIEKPAAVAPPSSCSGVPPAPLGDDREEEEEEKMLMLHETALVAEHRSTREMTSSTRRSPALALFISATTRVVAFLPQ